MALDVPPGTPHRQRAGRRLATLLGIGLIALAVGLSLGGLASGRLSLRAVAAAADSGPSPVPTANVTPTPAPVPTPAPTSIPAASLQARLDALRLQYHVPGVSVTIIWPDGRTWIGVKGWADVGRHVPVVTGTAFAVGSVSKTFLAALILQLVAENRLSLDDPVLRWLPAAKVRSGVTIRELLDHTSGLYDFFANPNIDAAILAWDRPTRPGSETWPDLRHLDCPKERAGQYAWVSASRSSP